MTTNQALFVKKRPSQGRPRTLKALIFSGLFLTVGLANQAAIVHRNNPKRTF